MKNSIISDKDNVGGIVGYLSGVCKVDNCSVENTFVEGKNNVGGMKSIFI